MTPTHFYNGGEHGEMYGDKPWLIETIDKIPHRKQKAVADRYSEIYQELALSDPDKCRFRANVWLRKIVKKYKPSESDIVPF